MVERGGTQRYAFTAKPTGTRWYHSHDAGPYGDAFSRHGRSEGQG